MKASKNTNPATANQAEQNNSQSNNSLKSKEDVMSKSNNTSNNSSVNDSENQKNPTVEQVAGNIIEAAASVNIQEQKDLEEKHKTLTDNIASLESEISAKQALLDKAKMPDSHGKTVSLTTVEKSRIKMEIKVAGDAKKKLEKLQREVAQKLKDIYKHQNDLITRANVRVAAQNDKYHNRFSENIYKAITEFIKSLKEDITKKYKASLTRINMEEKERLVISFCLKAPRFLVTKMTANEEWKKSYINHFITELNKIK